MNGSKICVSVGDETITGLSKKVRTLAGKYDLIEIRVDYLISRELGPAGLCAGLQDLLSSFGGQKFVITFRPGSEGGERPLSLEERIAFWNSGITVEYADLEIDISRVEFENSRWKHRILSAHNFRSADLPSITALVENSRPGDILKIAVHASDITGTLDVWKALAGPSDQSAGKASLIPVAMGECGKWTRILGPAFGAPFTYASQDEDSMTAPGQISAADLSEVYRVGALDRETEVYGVIGDPVSHSVSPYIHNAGFIEHGLNAVYIPLEVRDLKAFVNRMVREDTREIDWNLKGFSVTAPHKTGIIELLDYLDNEAEAMGSVNTVQLVDGKLIGFNTDADGFLAPLISSFGDLEDTAVAVIGGGGAARACVHALSKSGARVTVFARDPAQRESLSSAFGCATARLDELHGQLGQYQIAVNATPLGSRGQLESETPVNSEAMKSLQLAYDLVYNPYRPLFLLEAEKAGASLISGFEMLIAQGAAQFELWTGRPAPLDKMREAASSRLK